MYQMILFLKLSFKQRPIIIIQAESNKLSGNRTAKLWLEYIDMVGILRKFIKAERLGNWSLHLEAVSEMLPYLAVSGHCLYAKSARIYLQSLLSLEKYHSDVHQHFVKEIPYCQKI